MGREISATCGISSSHNPQPGLCQTISKTLQGQKWKLEKDNVIICFDPRGALQKFLCSTKEAKLTRFSTSVAEWGPSLQSAAEGSLGQTSRSPAGRFLRLNWYWMDWTVIIARRLKRVEKIPCLANKVGGLTESLQSAESRFRVRDKLINKLIKHPLNRL